MTIEVTISDRALQSMVLAACEAYAFGSDDNRQPVETYAHLWGHRRHEHGNEIEHIHVDRISVCVSAQVANDRVEVFSDVIALQDDIVKHWSPHLSLLGDFHTHPYNTLAELRECQGWQFSETDIASFLTDDQLWERADGSPLSMVMAITKLQNVHKGWARHPAAYRARFDIGQYRFYVSTAAGRITDNSGREFAQSGVQLHFGQYFYNMPGNRVGE